MEFDFQIKQALDLDDVERQYVGYILERNKGNVAKSAVILKVDRRTIYRMIARDKVSNNPRITTLARTRG